MSASHEPNGQWRARSRYTNLLLGEEQVTAVARTKALALEELRSRLIERREEDLNGPGIEPQSVAETFSAWKEHVNRIVANGDAKEQSVSKDRRHLDRNVIPVIGDRPIAQVRVSELERIIDDIVAEGFRRKAQLVRSSMIKLWAFALRHDLVERNTAEATTRHKVVRKTPVARTLPELTAVRQAIVDWEYPEKKRPGPAPSGRLLAGFDLMLGTGMRIGEAMALRWDDVTLDETEPRVAILASLYEVDGKTKVGATKTESSVRSLSLPPQAVESLHKIRPASPEPNAHVFATRSGTPTQPGNWRRTLRNALVRAEIDPEVLRPHDLRKTVGTRLEREAGIKVARQVLGHAPGSDITYRHYIEPETNAPDVSSFLTALWSDD